MLRRVALGGAGLAAGLGALFAWAASTEATGATARGDRLERMRRSPQYGPDGFRNRLPRVDGSIAKMLRRAFSDEATEPAEPLPVETRSRADFDVPPASGLRLTWFGHSSFLVEIDGARVLVDPIWGDRASPFSTLGPRRYYAPPLPLDELPRVDAIVISHDHYDHLDHPTVVRLRDVDTRWVVPLGVGAHLERWGVAPSRIVELDWWEDTRIGSVRLTCTPARHFSGRSLVLRDQNATLWSGWAMTGPDHRVFYSGDTALHPELETIGARLGPFDATLVEIGAYSPLWTDVHLGPEQAVIAHQLAGGRVLVPAHWGLFTLAPHGWTEPIERLVRAAERVGVTVAVPRPGGRIEPTREPAPKAWWPRDVPWRTASEVPVWSTSVESLLARSPLAGGSP